MDDMRVQGVTRQLTNERLRGDFDCVAGQWCNFTVDAHSTVGSAQFSGGDTWLVEVLFTSHWLHPRALSILQMVLLQVSDAPGVSSPWPQSEPSQRRTAAARGVLSDVGNGTYRGAWRLESQARPQLHPFHPMRPHR